MTGTIRTNEKCPFCGKKYPKDFICKDDRHFSVPTRFYIDLFWKGKRVRIFSDKYGEPLDSFRRASALHVTINGEIDDHTFDPKRYIRQDAETYFCVNLLDRFLTAKVPTLAPSYKSQYRRLVRRAQNFFNRKDVRDLRRLDLVNYMDDLEASGIRGKTRKNYVDLMRVFLRWCRDELEIIAGVPSFPHIEISQRSPRWISAEDQIKLLSFIPEEDQPIIRFLMLHGSRPAEARALKVKDVNIFSQVISISATFSGREYREQRKGRGAQPVVIPIHPELLDYMKERVKNALPGAWVFENPRTGGAYTENALRRIWEGVREKAGISRDLRLYDATRHSVASQLRLAGVSLSDIKDQLGHSDIRTTEKYAHGDITSLRTNLQKLSLQKVVSIETARAAKEESKSEDRQ